MVAAPGNTGARLWDDATQGTSAAPSGQPPVIVGGPEAVVYAPAGRIATNETGTLYIKTTDGSVATGWSALAPVV